RSPPDGPRDSPGTLARPGLGPHRRRPDRRGGHRRSPENGRGNRRRLPPGRGRQAGRHRAPEGQGPVGRPPRGRHHERPVLAGLRPVGNRSGPGGRGAAPGRRTNLPGGVRPGRWTRGHAGRRQPLAARTRPAPKAPRFAGETFRGKIILFGSAPAGEERVAMIQAVNPDGTALETVLELKGGSLILAGRVAPDGRRLAYSVRSKGAEREEVWVLEADGRRRKF